LFPFGQDRDSLARRFNEQTRVELESVRDFIILHYKQTNRTDRDFWNYCRTMDIPDSLAHRIDIFKSNGYVWSDDTNLFRIASWVQVMMGQGLEPLDYHSAGKLMSTEALQQSMSEISTSIDKTVQQLPTHQAFIERYCAMPSG